MYLSRHYYKNREMIILALRKRSCDILKYLFDKHDKGNLVKKELSVAYYLEIGESRNTIDKLIREDKRVKKIIELILQ
jgi:hypothetical protein